LEGSKKRVERMGEMTRTSLRKRKECLLLKYLSMHAHICIVMEITITKGNLARQKRKGNAYAFLRWTCQGMRQPQGRDARG
jgi:hypothetical protein